jgi:hypothetical protein
MKDSLRPQVRFFCCAPTNASRVFTQPGSFTSLWLLRSIVRMSASHPKATESLRSSEMTLSANWRPEQVQKLHGQNCGYSIIASASNWIEFGTLIPRALAVCRLMTNSNLVDCRTGRSAGFAPLRMLPV